MARKFYLASGYFSNGGLAKIDGRALREAENGNVLFLNMASDNERRTRKKGDFFRGYFKELKADSVSVLDAGASDDELDREFERAGLVCIPGGDIEILLRNSRDKLLVGKLNRFGGVVLGNSEGAYALCQGYLKIKRDRVEVVSSLGLVDFLVKAYYDTMLDEELKRLSKGKEIFALGKNSAIVCNGKGEDVSFIGNVWKFAEGKKEGVGERD